MENKLKVRDWLNKHKNHNTKLEYKYLGESRVMIQVYCQHCNLFYDLDTYSIKD